MEVIRSGTSSSLVSRQDHNIFGTISMFHRVIGLSSLLIVCVAGCSLRGHRDCNCHQHMQPGRHASNLNVTINRDGSCGDGSCSCTAPLYPGDQHCHQNCNKHKHKRRWPMQRMASAVRRSSQQWFSGLGEDECACGCDRQDSCFYEPCTNVNTMWPSGMDTSPAYATPSCGFDACGCDACAASMTNGWFPGATEYGAMNQGIPGCGCGEQVVAGCSTCASPENGLYEHSVESPVMPIPGYPPGNAEPRAFPPSNPKPGTESENRHMDTPKQAPDAPAKREALPMPQDMTPMELPMEFPENAPERLEPIEEGAPAAHNILDPISYEIPRLPPIPVRAHSSAKRSSPPVVLPRDPRSIATRR